MIRLFVENWRLRRQERQAEELSGMAIIDQLGALPDDAWIARLASECSKAIFTADLSDKQALARFVLQDAVLGVCKAHRDEDIIVVLSALCKMIAARNARTIA